MRLVAQQSPARARRELFAAAPLLSGADRAHARFARPRQFQPEGSPWRKLSRRTTPPRSRTVSPACSSEMMPKPRAEMRDYRAAGKLDGQGRADHRRRQRHRPRGRDRLRQGGRRRRDRLSRRARRRRRDPQRWSRKQGRRCIVDRRRHRRRGLLPGRRRAHGRGVRPARPAGQQRRRAAPAGPSRGHQRRAARAHLPHQHLRHVPPDQGGARRICRAGAAIINTASVTAYRGSPHLIDYAATKGAIVAFTRSLAGNLKERRIRVNAVAPGPVWTPLIPASFPAEHVESFGEDTYLGRPAEPDEIAPCYIFLASADAHRA